MRISAINTKIGTQNRTACFGWTGFKVSVRSCAPVATVCEELREFDARTRNVA
jgi:hypothetical protein